MSENSSINLHNEVDKFSVHFLASNICKLGLQRFIRSWNAHSIPNHGIPNDLHLQSNATTPVSPLEIWTEDSAVQEYIQQGGQITDPHPFANDPLEGSPNLQTTRTTEFLREVPYGMDFEHLFTNLTQAYSSSTNCNKNYHPTGTLASYHTQLSATLVH